jgi:uncharacterized protein YndB with AHSA1/START domain
MTRFQQSVVINRPLEQVFAFVSDLENDPQWTPGAVMRRTSQGQLGVGTTFQQRDRFMGRRMDLSLEVTDYEPPHRIGLRTISGQLSFGALGCSSRLVRPLPGSRSLVRGMRLGC